MKLKSGWIIPILKDLEEFASEAELFNLRDDLAAIVRDHQDELADIQDGDTAEVVPYPKIRNLS